MENNYLRQVLRWFRFRGLALVGVFLCGFIAFLMGVGVTDRAGVADADTMTKLYYTLGLFVLGGMDLGVPRGGPGWARGLLWTAYFLAPLVTASAVVEGVLRIIDPQTWKLRRLSDHIVIAGAGNLALLYLQRLREEDPDVHVVVVEKDLDATHIDLIRHRHRANIMRGDISSEAIMDSVNAAQARHILFLTGDDFANLEAATKVRERWPHLSKKLTVHVADLMLRRVLKRTDSLDANIFNSHQIAAQALVAGDLSKHFEETPNLDQVVLAGFGRFGQTVLDELLRECPDEFEKVVILDIKADRWFALFAEHHGEITFECHTISGDMTDPETWLRVYEHVDFEHSNPVIVLGSDQDEINIQVALWLRARLETLQHDEAKIFVRCFNNSALAARLAAECDFEVVSVADLISESMREWT